MIVILQGTAIGRHYLALLIPKSTLFTLRRPYDLIVLFALIYSYFGIDCSVNKNCAKYFRLYYYKNVSLNPGYYIGISYNLGASLDAEMQLACKINSVEGNVFTDY